MKKKLQKFLVFLFLALVLILWAGAGFYTVVSFLNRTGNDYFAPYMKLGNILRDGDGELSLRSFSKEELISIIKGLQSENHVLVSQSVLLNELERQNQELRRVANLPSMAKYNSVPAEITVRDPVRWFYSFTISCGSLKGVRKGCAVYTIDSAGVPLLLGQVLSVSKHTAKVLSIYHKDLHISGRLSENGITGLINAEVRSAFENHININYLPRDMKFIPDEEVYTGGFERNVPPGIKIGNLIRIDREESVFSNQLYVSGWIRPAADFNDIRFVYVAVPDVVDDYEEEGEAQ